MNLCGTVWNDGKACFFKGGEYVSYDISADETDPCFPAPIAAGYRGLPAAWAAGVDAVMVCEGKAYFFRAGEYLVYDIAGDRVEPSFPRPIAGNWRGLPARWADRIDAAVVWDDNQVYLFRDAEYLSYDVARNRVNPGDPQLIADRWPGLPLAWTTGIDTVVRWPDGKLYFFKGTDCLCVDVVTGEVDPGYPKPIAARWSGLFGPTMLKSYRIKLCELQCVDESVDPSNAAEPYGVFFVADLNRPIPRPMSCCTKLLEDGTDGRLTSQSVTLWGVNGRPAVIPEPDRVIVLAALVEHDASDPGAVLSSVQSSLAANLMQYVSSKLERDALVELLKKDMAGAIGCRASGECTDEAAAPVQELRLSPEILADARRTTVRQTLSFSGDGGEYRLAFDIVRA